MLKISYAGCPGLSPVILVQFTPKIPQILWQCLWIGSARCAKQEWNGNSRRSDRSAAAAPPGSRNPKLDWL